jgi:hypothetical protein
LADCIFGVGAPQQSVNQTCRLLADKGIIIRTPLPIKNYIADDSSRIESIKPVDVYKEQINKSDSLLQEEYIKKILHDYLIKEGWLTKVAWCKSSCTSRVKLNLAH